MDRHDIGATTLDDYLEPLGPQIERLAFFAFVLVLRVHGERDAGSGGGAMIGNMPEHDRRHTKPRQGSTSGIGGVPRIEPGGILDVNHPLPIGKVMLVCSSCGKPTRIGHRTLDNGRRVRVCKNCGEQLEVKS